MRNTVALFPGSRPPTAVSLPGHMPSTPSGGVLTQIINTATSLAGSILSTLSRNVLTHSI